MLPMAAAPHTVHLAGTTAYVANANSFSIVDVSDPAQPTPLSTYDLGSRAGDVATSGGVAYVVGHAGLVLVDIGDPSSPTFVAATDVGGVAEHVELGGRTAYVTLGAMGLQLFDVGNPAELDPLSLFDTLGYAQELHVTGQAAYVVAWRGGLDIVDIGDPSVPMRLGYVDSAEILDVRVDGSRAFFVDRVDGLQVIDVSRPEQPRRLGQYAPPGEALAVAVEGDLAIVACSDTFGGDYEIQVLDVINPTAPGLAGSFDLPEAAADLWAAGGRIYATGPGLGLWVLRYTGPAPSRAARWSGYR
jgi:hypothetical protein